MGNFKRFTDSQRNKLYTAEREAFEGHKADENLTPDEALELTARVWRASGALASTPGVRFSRKKGLGAAHYSPWCHRITYHPDSIHAWVVVHEVSHAIEREGASHGPEFARAYLAAVERTFGFEARELLGAAFRKHKVRSTGKSQPLKKGTGPKRETKMQKALKLSDAVGVRFRADGWNQHWYELLGPGGECNRSCYGLDEVIRELESRGAK